MSKTPKLKPKRKRGFAVNSTHLRRLIAKWTEDIEEYRITGGQYAPSSTGLARYEGMATGRDLCCQDLRLLLRRASKW